MTKKKKSDLTVYLLAGAMGGMVGNVALNHLFSPDQEKYVIQKEDSTSPTGGQKESICDKAIAPLRVEFSKNCTLENFDQGDALKIIIQRRDEILRKYGCEEQAWECKPTYSTNLDRRFKAEFSYK